MPQDMMLGETAIQAASIDIILAGLNQVQLHAVTNPAPVVQILAPPGSGKTRTLTARVAYLLASSGYNPSNVIVATFTVKASREMKERIGKLIGNGLERKLILGTFHSIARRYLVRYGHLIGLKTSFGIADSNDTLTMLKRIIKRNKFSIDANNARSRISHIKAQGLSYSEYTTRKEKTTKRNIGAQDFVVVYRDYQEALEQANLLDYDDLLLKCVELLKAHPEVTGNVEAVLVDEFQDTNLVQFDLMRGFAKWRKRVTIVGDPDQSIYGFRAAEIQNLKRMQIAYPNTLVVVLEENYRSSAAILQCAQMIIEQDKSRPNKALLPTHQVGTKPVLRYLKDAGQEAQWIVIELKRIMAMTGNTITPNDVAILVRSASQTRHIEGALAQHGIAYKMAGGLRFFDRVEVKTVVDYLRVIHNPGNNDALARVVNVPPRKVGEATIKALLDEGFQKKKSLWDVIKGGVRGELKLQTKLTKTAEQGLGNFVNVVLKARKLLAEDEGDNLVAGGGLDLDSGEWAQKSTLVDIVYYLMKQLKYQDYLERNYPEDYDSRWANIEELVMQAADFTNTLITLSEVDDEDSLPIIDGVEQRKPSAMSDALDRFLANIALVNEVEEEEEEGAVPRERVTISTIHSAKGLEWPVVYIPGCYEGSIPHSRCDDTDEERRLLYVAMTRAMGLLYMSCPKKNSKYEKSALSQFIKCPNVLRLLEKRGPNLTPATAQGLLHILGRVCPEIGVINEATAALESLEDDLFPVEDATDSDDEGNAFGYEGCGEKRRRLEDEKSGGYRTHGWESKNEQIIQRQGWRKGTGAKAVNFAGGFMSARSITTTGTSYASYSTSTTTMAAADNFSANKTSWGGFKSARGHLDGLSEKKLGTEADVLIQEMKNVYKPIGEKGTPTSSLKVEPAKRVVKKNPSIGQGSLLGFIKRTPAAANIHNKTMKMAGPIKQQSGVRGIQAAPEDEFVLLSSSPIKRKSLSPHPGRQRSSSRGSEDKTCVDNFEGESKLESKDNPVSIYIPDSEDEEEDEDDVTKYLPPPLPSSPKGKKAQLNSLGSKLIVPISDLNSDPIDPYINQLKEEQAYLEIEPLHSKSYEPVVPKPFLTRAKEAAFMSSTTTGKINQKLSSLSDSTTPQIPRPEVVIPGMQIAPFFNQTAAKVITQQQQQQQQRKKTLGIRRSMKGWDSRGNKSVGGAVPMQRGTGAGITKPPLPSSRINGKGE